MINYFFGINSLSCFGFIGHNNQKVMFKTEHNLRYLGFFILLTSDHVGIDPDENKRQGEVLFH